MSVSSSRKKRLRTCICICLAQHIARYIGYVISEWQANLQSERHDKWLNGNKKGQIGRDSFQLFVRVFDTYLVWYLLVLPSETHAVANMISAWAIDGDSSYYLHASL